MSSQLSRGLTGQEKRMVLLIFAPVTLILLGMLLIVYLTWQTPPVVENKEGAKSKQIDL